MNTYAEVQCCSKMIVNWHIGAISAFQESEGSINGLL